LFSDLLFLVFFAALNAVNLVNSAE